MLTGNGEQGTTVTERWTLNDDVMMLIMMTD